MELTMQGLTREIGEFVASPLKVPQACLDVAATGLADCVGVMLAGAAEMAPRITSRLCATSADADAVPEIPSGRRLAAADAALVNGVAAHVLDYDDVALAGHPSTVLVPAILAEGWALDRSGADVLAAYVIGYETWALLADLEPGSYHDRGFHPTAVLGTVPPVPI